MKFLRISRILLPAAVLLALASCHKERSSSSTPYVGGSLTYDMPSYVQYGDVIHIVPRGVYREDSSDTLLSVRWINPFTSVSDTVRLESDPASVDKAFDFVVDVDTVGTFSIAVYAWAEGYSAKSLTKSFTIIDNELDNGSLTGYGFLDAIGTFTDARDGKPYYFNTVDGTDWMISNLAYEGAGMAYKDESTLSTLFGQYYTWDEATAACPAGWHLPSDADFVALAKAFGAKVSADGSITEGSGALMGDIYFNGDKMWEFWPSVKITNSSKFSAIPAGYAVVDENGAEFTGFNDFAIFWTADADGALMGRARYIYVDKPDIFASVLGKNSVRASVRCVR